MSGRVLVVDDDRSIRRLVVEILRDEGFEPTPCENGSDALDYLGRGGADLVLLDMRMPVMDGWEFAAEMQRRKIDIPIVVMTASANARAWAQEISARGFVPKPFDLDDLVGAVRHVLEAVDEPPAD